MTSTFSLPLGNLGKQTNTFKKEPLVVARMATILPKPVAHPFGFFFFFFFFV
jgi:hypothetical protein